MERWSLNLKVSLRAKGSQREKWSPKVKGNQKVKGSLSQKWRLRGSQMLRAKKEKVMQNLFRSGNMPSLYGDLPGFYTFISLAYLLQFWEHTLLSAS